MHIANRRESLCSSWPAARRSLETSHLSDADGRWATAFSAVVSKREDSDPKLRAAVEKLAELFDRGVKVVVFTQRLETSKTLSKMLQEHKMVGDVIRDLSRRAERWRHHVHKVEAWIDLEPDYAAGVVKIVAHSMDCPEKIELTAVKRWWRKHKNRLGNGTREGWDSLKWLVGRGPVA